MKIQETKKRGYLSGLSRHPKRFLLFALLVVLIGYSILLMMLGGVLHEEGFFGEILKPAIEANIRLPYNYLKGLRSKPEHLVLDIKHKDYQKLAYKRELALSEGVLHAYGDDYVPAQIKWNNKTINAEIRLKGDLADHWARDYKWSLRIRAKGDDTLLGMKNFSLQHPRVRGFMNDWILHQILKKMGFIALRYDFVEVTINGKNLGIYAIEEHFEKRLIENNRRINAPIIRIKDNLLWYFVDPKTGFTKNKLDEMYSLSPIDAFTSGAINKDQKLLDNFIVAKNLLESFRSGYLPTHKVFDIDKLAELFAVIDLFGYRHTTAYSNIRFYYDPIVSRLVPIGYDNTFILEADYIEGQGKLLRSDKEKKDETERLDWMGRFFEDELFFQKYMNALQKVIDEHFWDSFFAEVDAEYNEKLNILYSNFPGYSFEHEKELLYKNQKNIRNILNPVEGVQAYLKNYDESSNSVILELGNIQFLPVVILSASINGTTLPILDQEVILQPKKPFRPIEFIARRFKLPQKNIWNDQIPSKITVNYRLFGMMDVKSVHVFPWTYLDKDFGETDIVRQEPNIHKFKFLNINEHDKAIYIKRGKWSLSTNLIVPDGYILYCGEGTEINLLNKSKIISYSPMRWLGQKESPILVYSGDFSGQGIVIINSKDLSVFDNVIFKNLDAPLYGNWHLSGMLTLYESPVEIRECEILEPKSEDGIMIIRSDFTISKIFIKGAKVNAINIIYSTGKIQESVITIAGSDGIRVSGSYLGMDNNYIQEIKNKSINVGERSSVTINGLEIKKSGAGIESRGGSSVIIEDVHLSEVGTAFSAYQDKTEFGPASIKANRVNMEQVSKVHSVGKGCSLTIDGNRM